jgi:hypothetical protein
MILRYQIPTEPIPTPALPLKGRVKYFSPFKGETREGDGVSCLFINTTSYEL